MHVDLPASCWANKHCNQMLHTIPIDLSAQFASVGLPTDANLAVLSAEHQQKYFMDGLVSARGHVMSPMSARLAVTYTYTCVTCGSKPVAACSLEVPDGCPVEGVHVPLPHVIQQHSPLSLHANNKQGLAWLNEVRGAVSCERHLQSTWWHTSPNAY